MPSECEGLSEGQGRMIGSCPMAWCKKRQQSRSPPMPIVCTRSSTERVEGSATASEPRPPAPDRRERFPAPAAACSAPPCRRGRAAR